MAAKMYRIEVKSNSTIGTSTNYITMQSLERCFKMHKDNYKLYKNGTIVADKNEAIYKLFDRYGPNKCCIKLVFVHKSDSEDEVDNSDDSDKSDKEDENEMALCRMREEEEEQEEYRRRQEEEEKECGGDDWNGC